MTYPKNALKAREAQRNYRIRPCWNTDWKVQHNTGSRWETVGFYKLYEDGEKRIDEEVWVRGK